MSPQEIKTIQKVAKAIAHKYTFGYYDLEDIEQECFILAMEAMSKYDKNQGTLENFLYTHLNFRMKNFLRKKYYRKNITCVHCNGQDLECESCQRRKWRHLVKKHLMEPIDINNINCNHEPRTYVNYDPLEQLQLDEIFSIINKHLDIQLRVDYLKMLEGLYIPKPRRDQIEGRIIEILEEHGYGE